MLSETHFPNQGVAGSSPAGVANEINGLVVRRQRARHWHRQRAGSDGPPRLAVRSVVPLWQGVVLACLDVLVGMFRGRFFFRARIPPPGVAGITVIALGVLLVGWGGQ